MKRSIPLNAYDDEVINASIGGGPQTCRTIKAQYQKTSLANFVRQDGLGATGVMVIYETD